MERGPRMARRPVPAAAAEVWDLPGDHLLFQKHSENKTGEEFLNLLNICGVHFRHVVLNAFPVPAGVSNQGMYMWIPVCHSTEGLRNEDSAGENIPAIKSFVKEYRKRIPGTPAELREKLSVMHEVQPEQLWSTPHPVPVRNRPEEFLLKEDYKVQ